MTAALLPALAGADGPVAFETDVPVALRVAGAQKKHTVIVFGATWCQWCRRMAVTTLTDSSLGAVAARVVWAKVDIDADRETAATFNVQGVPAVAVVSPEGQTVAMKSGYQTAPQLLEFLNGALTPGKGDSPGPGLVAKLQAAGDQDRQAVLAEAIEALARPDRSGREPLVAGIRALGPGAWESLAEFLGDKRLAVRAAAAEVLTACTGAALPFDPFASDDQRAQQLDSCRQWLRGRAGTPASRPAAATSRPG